MSDESERSDEGLIRAIGVKALGTNVFNMVVGGGIFALPGLVAAILGPAAVFAYLICAVAVGLVFLCFAEVGSRVTRSGGAYAYIEEAFGPFAGFIASMLLWLGWAIFSNAAILIVMVDTLTLLIPELGDPILRAVLIIVLLGFMAYTNIKGVKSGVKLYMFNTAAKLVPLTLLLVVGFFYMKWENLVITEMPSFESIGAATITLIFAFSGAECALNASGEVKNPKRTVPLGLLFGLIGIFVLYFGLQSVSQGVLGPELANNTAAPLAAAAESVFGPWGKTMLIFGAAISIYSTISGDILVTPRVVFASARDGALPSIFAKVHPKYKTPYIAVGFYTFLMAVITISGQFKLLAVLASGSILMVYAGVSLAAIQLRRRDGMPKEGQFKIPGHFIIPVLSCLVIIWMLSQITYEEAIGLFGLLGVSAAIFLIKKYAFNKE